MRSSAIPLCFHLFPLIDTFAAITIPVKNKQGDGDRCEREKRESSSQTGVLLTFIELTIDNNADCLNTLSRTRMYQYFSH